MKASEWSVSSLFVKHCDSLRCVVCFPILTLIRQACNFVVYCYALNLCISLAHNFVVYCHALNLCNSLTHSFVVYCHTLNLYLRLAQFCDVLPRTEFVY